MSVMKSLTAAVLCAGLVYAAASPSPARAQVAEGIAAVVNDQVITTYDVRQRALLLLASSGIQPNRDAQQRAASQALRDLIDERLQLQEAAKFEIEVDPQQITDQIDDLARQSGTSRAELESQMQASGIRLATLRDQVRAEIAWRRLINGLYGSRIRISPVEVDAALARVQESATRAQYLVSEIFLPAETEQEVQEAFAGAARLLEEMQRGAPFPLVARQFSAAASAVAGGDLGWLTAGELAPTLQSAVDVLQPGQVSTPIVTPRGVYLIALRDRRSGVDPSALSAASLLRVSAPRSSREALERMRRAVTGCPGLASLADPVPGADIQDLGTRTDASLDPAARDALDGADAGNASRVFETSEGELAVLVVCSRSSGAGLPTRRDVEDRLFDEELTMLAQRHLRNLRREASITQP